jgi:uncharacterized iron-regulated membrane protein
MLETIATLGIVPGIICVIIGFLSAAYFWFPRRNGKPTRRADSTAGMLAQILAVLVFLAPGTAIVLGNLT